MMRGSPTKRRRLKRPTALRRAREAEQARVGRLRKTMKLRAALPLALVALVGCVATTDEESENIARVAQPLTAVCTANVIGTGKVDVETKYLPGVVHCENGGAP